MFTHSDNFILNSLSAEARRLLLTRASVALLPAGTLLYAYGEQPTYAYFITSGIASILTTTSQGDALEVGLIGREGFTGSLHLLGEGLDPTRCSVQTTGTALRITFSQLTSCFQASEEIRGRVLEFVQNQTLTLLQLAACHRFHSADARLARMLLMLQDRSDSDSLGLTHEALAELLGVQRSTVSVVVSGLQKAGVLACQRGHLRILDRAHLRSAACPCYAPLQQLYLRLFAKGGEYAEQTHGDLESAGSQPSRQFINDLSTTPGKNARDLEARYASLSRRQSIAMH